MLNSHRERRLPFLFLCVCVAASVPGVTAWGKTGHQIVANIAWRLLSNSSQTQLLDILSKSSYGVDPDCGEDCSPLAQVADWADVARYSSAYHWSAPLHYIDIEQEPCHIQSRVRRNRQCFFNYTRDCPHDACVAGAIVNFTNHLVHPPERRAADAPDVLQRTSLMFLVHFVGDIHQPLHCSRTADKGGNDIHVDYRDKDRHLSLATPPNDPTVDSRETDPRTFIANVPHYRKQNNLHSFWDSFMIEKSMHEVYNGSRAALEDVLWIRLTQASDHQWASWLDCANGADLSCATQWGQESLEYALTYAYRNVNGTEIRDGTTLTREYYETRSHVVWKRLMLAGIRLASTLDTAMATRHWQPLQHVTAPRRLR